MMTENSADILRGSLDPTDYSQLVIHYQSVKKVINEIENRLCYQRNVRQESYFLSFLLYSNILIYIKALS